MHHADFIAEGYYYDGGKALVQVETILEAPNTLLYKVFYEEPTDEVLLEESDTHAIRDFSKDTDRDFLRACYPPLDPNRVGSFIH